VLVLQPASVFRLFVRVGWALCDTAGADVDDAELAGVFIEGKEDVSKSGGGHIFREVVLMSTNSAC